MIDTLKHISIFFNISLQTATAQAAHHNLKTSSDVLTLKKPTTHK
jgi:hypothetical protein